MTVFHSRIVIAISHTLIFESHVVIFRISHSDFSISNIDYWNSIGDFELIPLLSCLACHTLAQYVEPLWVTQSTMKYHSRNSSRQFCHVIQLSALSSLHVFHAILRCLDWYLVIWNRNQNALKKKNTSYTSTEDVYDGELCKKHACPPLVSNH